MKSGMATGVCLFCGSGRHAGGLVIRGSFICGSCERGLINTGCDDLLYYFYIKGLRKMWRCIVA